MDKNIVCILLFAALLQNGYGLEAVFGGRLPVLRTSVNIISDNNDRVYVLGGILPGTFQPYDKIDVFNLISGTVEEVGSFPLPGGDATQLGDWGSSVVDAEGNIFYSTQATATANHAIFRINPGDNSVTEFDTTLNRPRFVGFHTVSDNAHTIYILGGFWQDTNYLEIWSIDTLTGIATFRTTLPNWRVSAAGVWFEDSVYLLGGLASTGSTADVFRYMPSVELMNVVHHLNRGVTYANAVLVDDTVYLIGGILTDSENIPGYHYTKFNLRTFESSNHNFTNIPGDMELGTWISATYVEQTREIIIVGGLNTTTFEYLSDIYRIKL